MHETVPERFNKGPCTIPVMVYGSLMADMSNHSMMDNEDMMFGGFYETCDFVRLFSLGAFPGMSDTTYSTNSLEPGEASFYGILEGELYWVTHDALMMLDGFEGCPDFYQRKAVKIRPQNLVSKQTTESWDDLRVCGSPTYSVPCWMYVLNPSYWDNQNALTPRHDGWKRVHNWKAYQKLRRAG